MINDHIKIRSSIQPDLKRSVLFRGTIFGGVGIGFILYAGIYLPPFQLHWGGVVLFLLGIVFVTMGLLPYRRLCRLEMKPNEILIHYRGLSYCSRGILIFSVPYSAIKKLKFCEERYGIGILLHDLPKEKVIVHQNHFDMERFIIHSKKKHDVDLYLPYFSKKSFLNVLKELPTKK